MRRLVTALTAAVMLAGCSAKEAEVQENTKDETTVVTTEITSAVTSSETASAQKTAAKKTTAKTTTVQTTAEASASESKATASAPQNTASSASEKHYTLVGYGGPEEIPEAEWKALTKVNEKYGKTFEVVNRILDWEHYPKTILNDDGTTTVIPYERDPNEPLDVFYVLKDSDGVCFEAHIKENTDIITHDTYLFHQYKERIYKEAAGSLQKLVPGGKVYFNGSDNGELPFESPAEMTYEEFRQALAENKGYVFGWVYVAEGMDVSDDMRAYSPRRGDGHPGEYGYLIKVHVAQVSQEDYDRLDDMTTEYPGQMEMKTLN